MMFLLFCVDETANLLMIQGVFLFYHSVTGHKRNVCFSSVILMMQLISLETCWGQEEGFASLRALCQIPQTRRSNGMYFHSCTKHLLTTSLTRGKGYSLILSLYLQQQLDNMKPKSLPSRLFDRNLAAASGETRAAKYQRHVDSVDPSEDLDQSAYSEQVANYNRQNKKHHREIQFSFLPERYEPLLDDEEQLKAKEKKKRKKEKYKKVRKAGKQTMPLLPLCYCSKTPHMQFFVKSFWFSSCPDPIRNSPNIGKALRCTWKCVMLGLYNFALGYSTPITVAATFAPDFHPARNQDLS